MKLSSFTVLLIWATLSIAGLAFLPLLRVQWQPSHTLPSVTVSYSWPNVSGRVVEQEATSLLEGGLNRIRGIRKISSTSRNNSGYITIEFDKTVDMDAVRFEVASAIRQLYPKLPEGVGFPTLSLNRPNNEQEKALLVYSLQASANPAGIQQYAEEQIKPVLSQIEGVSRIAVYGASPYEWMIEYDAVQLQAIGLTPSSLQQAVKRHYNVEPLGMVQDVDDRGRKAWMQLTVGNADTRHIRFEEIPLQSAQGRTVRLGDIATVRHTEQEPTSYYRINGMNTINLVIYASSQANHIVLAQQVKTKLAAMESLLPKGYSTLNTYDSTEYISGELNKMYTRTIATICILLLFILIVTRKFRFLMIILLSIMANICIALGMYYLLHIEIHLYSLAGIAISLGLIIDNAIVMMEHIRSRGNRRVFVAILAATLTTAISLSAVFLLDERIKLDLVDFAIVVIINLLVSLASAWFLTPALYDRLVGKSIKKLMIKNRKSKIRRVPAMASRIYTSTLSGIRRRQWIAWTALVLGFGLPVFLLPDKLEGKSRWAGIYNKTLGSPWYIEKAKPVVGKVLGGSLRLFVQFVYEGSQWNPNRERTTLNVYANMPPGSTIVQMNQSMEMLEQYLSGFKEIDRFQTNVHRAQNASISITFKKEHEFGYFPHQLKSQLITWGINSGASDWSVYGVGDGFSNRMYETNGQYRIQLYGYNFDQLYGYAEDIRRELLQYPRIKEVNLMSRYTWEKNIDREFTLTPDIKRLAMSGISLPAYFNMVRSAAGNEQIALGIVIDGTYQNIKYKAKQLAETDRWSLYNSLLHTGDTYLKLSSNSEMVKEAEQMEICKENQQYTMTVCYDYIGSSRFGSKLHERTVKEANEILPLGYKAEVVGWSWWQKEKKQYWLIILILAVMYVLCAILFESLWQPLAVISLVPFAFIGLFLTFYLFHLNFDQGGFAALVLLCGLTVNAAIYIINDYNNLKTSHCSSRRVYMQALHGKITPVMLTILSTILGLIPFVAGEHREPFWFALAAGTMGGLLFSLVGILFYLPLFFFKRNGRARPVVTIE
ncbi:MAG: efflux RND transporter permease subunit [Bacteroidales bacterium]|jgi:multidrug efflux pump subunit AcrB|nr:efflux RND transporter permease subunit [Bacteroidales bacterium]